MDLFQQSKAPIFMRLLAKRQHGQGTVSSTFTQSNKEQVKRERLFHKKQQLIEHLDQNSNQATDVEMTPTHIPPEGGKSSHNPSYIDDDELITAESSLCRKRKATYCTESDYSPSLTPLSSSAEEEKDAIPDFQLEAQEICSARRAQIIKTQCNAGCQSFNIRCDLGHVFWMSNFEELRENWCTTCQLQLQQLQQRFNEEFGGRIIDQIMFRQLKVECCHGHIYDVNHKKVLEGTCKACKQAEKDAEIKQLIEEKQRRMLEDKLLQDRLLEEARQEYLEKRKSSQNTQRSTYAQRVIEECQEALRRFEDEAKHIAEESSNEEESFSREVFVEIFKYESINEESLANYFMCLSQEELKGEYRRLAKIIHPDKNHHPRANAVFQKLSHCYGRALARKGCATDA